MSKRQRPSNPKQSRQRQQPLQGRPAPESQPQTGGLSDLLQRAELAPGSLNPAQLIQLQRTVGNQATGRLMRQPPDLIQRNGGRNRSNNTTQHPYSKIALAADPPHLTKSQFRKKLKLGTFSLEGTSLKAIQDEIKAYEQNWKVLSQNLKDKAWTDFEENFKKGVEMLGQIETDMQYYKTRHDGEKGHEARVTGMGEAIALVGLERGALPQVGNLSTTTRPLSQVFSKQKGRQSGRDKLITDEADNVVKDLNDNYFKLEAIKPVLEVFGVNTLDMNKSREALELRRQLKLVVKAQISSEIDAVGAGADQVEDAKRFVDKLSKSVQGDILDKISNTEAGKIVADVITAKSGEVKSLVEGAMRSAPLTEPNGKVKLRAYVAGKDKLADIQTEAVNRAKAGIKDIVKTGGTSQLIDDLKSGVTTETGTKALGTKEITERQNLEATLENFAAQAAPLVIDNEIKKPLKLELAFRLGEKRQYLRKSNSSRGFREALKGAARDKVAEKIYQEVDTQSTQLGLQGKDISDTRKAFAALQAQSLLYEEVKKYVDEVSLAKADEIITASLPGDLEAQLKKSAKTELYSHTRFVKPSTLANAQQLAWATNGASAKAKSLYPGIETAALNEAKTLIGDVTAPEVDNLKTKVKDEVEQNQDVTGAVKQVIEAENISTGLAIIGGLIDTQVANIGSSVKLDLQLKIPVFNQGVTGYITIQFLGEAGRDQAFLKGKKQPGQKTPKLAYDKLKAKAELTFGFGVQLAKVFDINAQFGLVLEAQAENSTKMMQLFSYGAYRRFRDNGLDKAADAIWGMGGKTRKKGGGKYTAKEEAEIWAALVEEEAFNLSPKKLNKIQDPTLRAKLKKKYRDAYVNVGLIGKAKAIGNAGIGKVEAEAKYSHSTQYSKRTVGTGLGKTNKTPAELREANKGRKVHYVELSGKLETLGESLSGEAKLKITILGGDPTAINPADRESKLLSAELELEVQVIAAFGKDYHKSMEIMAKYIGPLAAAITKFVDTARNAISSDDPAKRSGSSIAGVAGDLAFPLSEIENGNEIAKGVIESAGTEWEDVVMGTKNPLFEHKAALALGVKLGIGREKPEKPLAFAWEIALLSVKASKIDSGVFKAEFETKQKLGRVGSEGVGGLGFGKM